MHLLALAALVLFAWGVYQIIGALVLLAFVAAVGIYLLGDWFADLFRRPPRPVPERETPVPPAIREFRSQFTQPDTLAMLDEKWSDEQFDEDGIPILVILPLVFLLGHIPLL